MLVVELGYVTSEARRGSRRKVGLEGFVKDHLQQHTNTLLQSEIHSKGGYVSYRGEIGHLVIVVGHVHGEALVGYRL